MQAPFKKIALIALATGIGFSLAPSAHADPQHDAANYVNAIHHARLLDSLRTSFDRWDNLAREYPTAREQLEDFHIYGAQYDLNYGTKADNGKRIFPQTFGLAGQQLPVVVVVTGNAEGRYVLVAGYKRVRALSKLRCDTVRAVCSDLAEEEALLLGRLMHTAEVASALEQGWLLRELRVAVQSQRPRLEDVRGGQSA